jgi:hypothetical protein
MVLGSLLALPAAAQLKLDANRLRPAGDPNGVLAAEGAALPESLRFYASLTLHEAFAPLVFVSPDGTREPLVGHRLGAHLWGTVGLLDLEVAPGARLRFGFNGDLATALFQGGSLAALAPLSAEQKLTLDAIALGDLRLRPRVGIHLEGFDAALEGEVNLPTGAAEAMNGDGGLGGGGALAAAGGFGPLRGLARLGLRGRPETDTPFLKAGGGEFWAQVGVTYRLLGDGFLPEELAGELDFATRTAAAFDADTTALEWRVGARWCAAGLLITGALGAGASHAYGVPAFRMLAGVGYAPGVCGDLPFLPASRPGIEPARAPRGPGSADEAKPAEIQRVPVGTKAAPGTPASPGADDEPVDDWDVPKPARTTPAPGAPAPARARPATPAPTRAPATPAPTPATPAPAAPPPARVTDEPALRPSPVYTPPPSTDVRDFDEDGVPDEVDECFDEPGTAANKGCPGKAGAKPPAPSAPPAPPAPAAAPAHPAPPSAAPAPAAAPPSAAPAAKKPGSDAPPDADGDGVPDLLDFCPDEKGDSTRGGCP